MNYDDWHRLYREEEDYEYLEYVDNELKRLRICSLQLAKPAGITDDPAQPKIKKSISKQK